MQEVLSSCFVSNDGSDFHNAWLVAMLTYFHISQNYPDSKVHGANMGPIWGRQDPGGPHVGPMNLAIWGVENFLQTYIHIWKLSFISAEVNQSNKEIHAWFPCETLYLLNLPHTDQIKGIQTPNNTGYVYSILRFRILGKPCNKIDEIKKST